MYHPAAMVKMRAVRGTVPFSRGVFERPAMWVVAPFAARLPDTGDFPAVTELDRVLGPLAGVRFEEARPGPAAEMYDARIVRDGVVPTRARSWHDLMNALVWAAFPRAKEAVHAQQARFVEAAVDAASGKQRNARSPEHDRLAMIDEGGVIVLEGSGVSASVLFGHAVYETLALGGAMPRTRAVAVEGSPVGAPRDLVARADAGLSKVLRG